MSKKKNEDLREAIDLALLYARVKTLERIVYTALTAAGLAVVGALMNIVLHSANKL